MNLTTTQQNQLNAMESGKWYEDYQVRNGKTMKALCENGLVEFVDNSRIYIGYSPWKYGKKFRKK